MLVYKVTNQTNEKSYIGVTSNLDRRREEHERLSKRNNGYALHRAIKRYGKSNFSWTILEDGLEADIAFIKERTYITEMNTQQPNGYNLTEGGDAPPSRSGKKMLKEVVDRILKSREGYKHSEETRQKMRLSSRPVNRQAIETSVKKRKGKTYEEIYGPEKALEIKIKQQATKSKTKPHSTSNKAKFGSIEHRAKIGAANKGKHHPKSQKLATEAARVVNLGKSRSESTKLKISEKNIGRKRTDMARLKMREAWVRRKLLNNNKNEVST